MAPRPRLASAHRPLVRVGGAVQLGLRPESGAVLLSGLTAAEVAFLDRLDGRHTEAGLYAVAHAVGVESRRAEELLAVLRHHGVLASETARVPVPTRRPRGLVVDGSGPLATSIAGLLRAGAAGPVDSGPWAADAADAALRTGSGGDPPDLVVLVTDRVVDPRSGEPWWRRRVPLLPVLDDGDRVVVGPWISGDPAEPCLECLRLTRVPPGAVPGATTPPATGEPVDAALVAIGAGLAAMVARAGLEDRAAPPGVSVEVRTPWPRIDHRRWRRHPDCPHHGTGVRPAGRSLRPGG